jgi:hypothetical protein
VNNLLGRNHIEDSLRKLDTLTTEEACMATAEIWKVTHSVDDTVNRVDDKVGNVDVKVTELIDGRGKMDFSGYLHIPNHGYH